MNLRAIEWNVILRNRNSDSCPACHMDSKGHIHIIEI